MKLTIPKVDIIRLWEGSDGTFGALKIGGFPFCVTLELPDKDNLKNVSCIPAPQCYYCKRRSSSYGETFEVLDVYGNRTGILFHPGNFIKDSRGCILVGESWWKFHPAGERGIKNSGSTFKRFMEVLDGHNYFRLAIGYYL